jgi:hypothetical protein
VDSDRRGLVASITGQQKIRLLLSPNGKQRVWRGIRRRRSRVDAARCVLVAFNVVSRERGSIIPHCPPPPHSLDGSSFVNAMGPPRHRSFCLASKLSPRRSKTLLAQTLALFFWLNRSVKSVSRSSLSASAEERLGLGGERCAHISGIEHAESERGRSRCSWDCA